VGLTSPAVRREEDIELTFEVGDGVTGSWSLTGVGDDDEGTAGGIKAKGRVGNGVGTMAPHCGRRQRHRGRRRRWHGIEGGGDIEGGKLGQPNGANQNFTVIRVSRRWGYSPYTRYVIGIG
jgi:hypothetical protein